jgi:hypothetical protein
MTRSFLKLIEHNDIARIENYINKKNGNKILLYMTHLFSIIEYNRIEILDRLIKYKNIQIIILQNTDSILDLITRLSRYEILELLVFNNLLLDSKIDNESIIKAILDKSFDFNKPNEYRDSWFKIVTILEKYNKLCMHHFWFINIIKDKNLKLVKFVLKNVNVRLNLHDLHINARFIYEVLFNYYDYKISIYGPGNTYKQVLKTNWSSIMPLIGFSFPFIMTLHLAIAKSRLSELMDMRVIAPVIRCFVYGF